MRCPYSGKIRAYASLSLSSMYAEAPLAPPHLEQIGHLLFLRSFYLPRPNGPSPSQPFTPFLRYFIIYHLVGVSKLAHKIKI